MAKVVVLGAGISGHTAALYLKKLLTKNDEVVVVSPNSNFQWIPSNIWVGVGLMKPDDVKFPLAPVYKRQKISYLQAKAIEINPEGNVDIAKPFVRIEYVSESEKGKLENITYDYLVNATGPLLNFDATPGLGPNHFTNSVCTYDHAEKSWQNLKLALEKMQNGEHQTFLIGTGHPMATCQGAAFEYALNIAFEIDKRKLNHLADIVWISNEYELGDFGMGGAYINRGGYVTPTKVFTESVLAEYGIRWIKRAGVFKVEKGKAYYELLDGSKHEQTFDFSMLIPGFAGAKIKAFNNLGEDITSTVFAPNNMMKVDADYSAKPYESWKASDWPEIYQNPTYHNLYAAGIAFAPPHPMSKPMESPNGTKIFPTPPRTGMPSGVIGKVVAQNIAHRIKTGKNEHPHKASMAKQAAACIVSAGYGFTKGQAATMTVSPIVPDWEKYPEYGRDINATVGVIGLAGHWMKLFMHYMFIYKAKAKFGWSLIPE
ncbi:MAG TPA: sulfide:quinone reductase [Bacteroidales bacterium]|nr:sulfide:quinone reductase [Bacteroidales bacterium]